VILSGRPNLRGTTPLNVGEALSGVYELRIWKKGFVPEVGMVYFSRSGEGTPRLVSPSWTRSILWPGGARYVRSDRLGGAVGAAVGAYFLGRAIQLNRGYVDARSDARAAYSKYLASSDPDDLAALKREARERSELRDFSYSAQLRWGLAFVAMWGLNLADYYLGASRPEMTVSGQAVSFRLRPLKKKGMLARSLVFPGWGQRYAGYELRGKLYSIAGQVAVAALLATEDDYLRKSFDYERAKVEYSESRSEAEIPALRRAVIDCFNELRDARNLRNLSLAALGGVWVMNLVDCSLLGTEGKGRLWSADWRITAHPVVEVSRGRLRVLLVGVSF